MLKLWKFYWDCGRNGNLNGIFVATKEQIDYIVGREVYFGEVLGKHSEIYGVIELEDFTELTDDQEFIEKAINYGLVPNGFNPFNYVEGLGEDGS